MIQSKSIFLFAYVHLTSLFISFFRDFETVQKQLTKCCENEFQFSKPFQTVQNHLMSFCHIKPLHLFYFLLLLFSNLYILIFPQLVFKVVWWAIFLNFPFLLSRATIFDLSRDLWFCKCINIHFNTAFGLKSIFAQAFDSFESELYACVRVQEQLFSVPSDRSILSDT